MENYEEFLSKLSELSITYGIYIDGCGCCDSPYLVEEEPKRADGRLAWDMDKKEYYY